MIRYVALLRGINISGKNKISMSELKQEFEKLNFSEVFTYINSGNVVFNSDIMDKDMIKNKIKLMISNKFNFDIPIYIITTQELEELLSNSPEWWGNNSKETYDNIIFVIPPTTYDDVFNILGSPNQYEQIKEYENNIFWSYSLKDYRKTNWWSKTVNTSISNSITIRTANTVRKILELSKMTSL